MRRLVDLVRLSRLDRLIRMKATGSPEQLAEKLGLSRSTLFEDISFLKEEMGAPISYDRHRPSYFYEYIPKFNLGFEQDKLASFENLAIVGGTRDITEEDTISTEAFSTFDERNNNFNR